MNFVTNSIKVLELVVGCVGNSWNLFQGLLSDLYKQLLICHDTINLLYSILLSFKQG